MSATTAIIMNALFLIPVLISLDFYTPWVYLAFSVLFMLFHSPKALFKWLPYFLLALVLSFWVVLTNYFHTPGPEAATRALILGLRSLSLLGISATFAASLQVSSALGAAMQQGWITVRLGYSLFTALNLIPRVRNERQLIVRVHRIRTGKRGQKWIQQAITLLAGAIRQAERSAQSMQARGIERANRRTFLNAYPWTLIDTIFLVVGLIFAITGFLWLQGLNLFTFGFY